jgi:putative transposase
MPRRSAPITLSPEPKDALERLVRAHSTPQQLVVRARIILLAHDGLGVTDTARRLGVWRKTVSTWRARWLTRPPEASVAERLSDAPRPGAPATFTPEQICTIVALACEPPETSGLPITHWSQSELARQAMKRGLVERISPRQVGRLLKRSRPPAASRADVAHPQARSPVRGQVR